MKLKGKENQLSSPAETAAPAVDAMRDAMVAAIRGTLGAAVVDSLVKPSDDIWVRVSTESWRNSIQKLKDVHGFDYFCFLSAIDWLPSPFGRGEDPSVTAPFALAIRAATLACSCWFASSIQKPTWGST
jgi:NADH-quinone oxidoreductase subunit C